MKSFNYIIQDEIGIHARPAGQLVKEAKQFNSKITLSSNGNTADAKKLIAIMSLGIQYGAEVNVTAEGVDEEEAIEQMEEFFKTNL